MSRCNFPFPFALNFSFSFPGFSLPSLPVFSLAIPWPPPCPLD